MPLDNLDPELAPGLLDRADTDWSVASLPKLRAERVAAASRHGDPPASVEISDVQVAADGRDIHLRVYRPSLQSSPLPALFWIHGGGMVLGCVEYDDPHLCAYVESLNVVVMAVDYRVAPEHPYPAPLEDCFDGLVHAHECAEHYGVDRERIAIGGLSAGGGLAAGVALLARDRGGPRLAFQLLLCPMLDDRLQTTSSTAYDEDVSWGTTANRFGWDAYLGDRFGTDAVPHYAAPARADDLSRLPPAFVDVGELEVFRDECILYAQKLMASGVSAELHVYPGAYHAFDRWAPDATLSKRARLNRLDALNRAFAAE